MVKQASRFKSQSLPAGRTGLWQWLYPNISEVALAFGIMDVDVMTKKTPGASVAPGISGSSDKYDCREKVVAISLSQSLAACLL